MLTSALCIFEEKKRYYAPFLY